MAFNTSVSGALQIVAFNNLYVGQTMGETGGAGCTSATGPSVLFAYDTRLTGDTTGATDTSIVLSLDGTKMAYVENNPSGALLKILQWKSGEGTIATPVAPDDTTLTSWTGGGCPAGESCLITVPFGNAQPDTLSSAYYDYETDNLYVGDDNGNLHKFTGVFGGTPAEDLSDDGGGAGSSTWPIEVQSSNFLLSPVFDGGSQNIYVNNVIGRTEYVMGIGSTTGACEAPETVPPCIGSTINFAGPSAHIKDGPVVDPFTGHVFIFANNDDAGNNADQPSSEVISTDMTLGSEVVDALSNNGMASPATSYTHVGAFDYAYLNSAPGSKAGHMYVCGKTDDANPNDISIARISFTASGALTGSEDGDVILTFDSADTVGCSPVTEITNTSRVLRTTIFSLPSIPWPRRRRPPSFAGVLPPDAGNSFPCLMSLVVGTVTSGVETPIVWPGNDRLGFYVGWY